MNKARKMRTIIGLIAGLATALLIINLTAFPVIIGYGATVDDFAEMGVTDAAGAAEKMYEWYSNWERACQWVWSTCIDDTVCDKLKIPHQGTYVETVENISNYKIYLNKLQFK